jgi:DNA-directed RNA polymerase specialized sigma24 family protein
MSNRPEISPSLARRILIAHGHRCAVCGEGCTLESAIMIICCEAGANLEKGFLCLCAACQQRARDETWPENILHEFQRVPWIVRKYGHAEAAPEPATSLHLTIASASENFDETTPSFLRSAIAAFLRLSPYAVHIAAFQEDGARVTLALHAEHSQSLVQAWRSYNSDLAKYLQPFALVDLHTTAPEPEPGAPEKEWSLTPEAFNKFLAALDSDPKLAAVKYEESRRKLVKYFAEEKCADPEELADRAIDCAARKISEGETVRAIDSYLRAVAWRILHEHWREQSRLRPLDPDEELLDDEQPQEKDQLLACTEQCLQKLSAKNRTLFLAYYEGEKHGRIAHRVQMAKEMNTNLNQLRKRIFKIREPFEACVDECRKRQTAG